MVSSYSTFEETEDTYWVPVLIAWNYMDLKEPLFCLTDGRYYFADKFSYAAKTAEVSVAKIEPNFRGNGKRISKDYVAVDREVTEMQLKTSFAVGFKSAYEAAFAISLYKDTYKSKVQFKEIQAA